MNDDMSDYWNGLRAPYWFDAVKGDGKIKFNSSNNCYDFKISLDNEGKEPVTFSIPAKCFTADMPEAKAFLNNNKTHPWWITRLLRKIPVSNEM
ncbi:MAG: hypothetical protein PHH77_05845 [Victivallaceae bacterium]|nr:hypothetical protein [Victivallaceae bacterium]